MPFPAIQQMNARVNVQPPVIRACVRNRHLIRGNPASVLRSVPACKRQHRQITTMTTMILMMITMKRTTPRRCISSPHRQQNCSPAKRHRPSVRHPLILDQMITGSRRLVFCMNPIRQTRPRSIRKHWRKMPAFWKPFFRTSVLRARSFRSAPARSLPFMNLNRPQVLNHHA